MGVAAAALDSSCLGGSARETSAVGEVLQSRPRHGHLLRKGKARKGVNFVGANFGGQKGTGRIGSNRKLEEINGEEQGDFGANHGGGWPVERS